MGKKRKTLYLIDGYSEVYRFYFAMFRNPLTTSMGENVGATYAFTRSLLSILREDKPDLIAVVFDPPKPIFRHKIYPEYKATREKMPEDLRSQLPYIFEIVEALNIQRIEVPGFEADDCIGTLAREGETENSDVLVVSSDKDFAQLVSKRILLYNTRAKSLDERLIDEKGVKDKWGVPPDRIRDLLALTGDSSDNIPGVKGIGPKGAVKLLDEYGSLESIYERIEEISGRKMKENLKAFEEDAHLSKELVTIRTDVSVGLKIKELKAGKPDYERLEEIFKKLEFWSLLESIGVRRSATITKKEKKYITVTDKKSLIRLAEELSRAEILSFDIESTSLNPFEAEIVGVALSIKPYTGWYIPVRSSEKEGRLFKNEGQEIDEVLDVLRPIFENETLPKCGQNCKYDMHILSRYGVEVRGVEFDSMIAAYLLRPDTRSYKLDTLARGYLGYEMIPITELIGSGNEQKSMSEVPLEEISEYAIEDADIALQLVDVLGSKLEESGAFELFREVEMPLVPVLMKMEQAGVYLDIKLLRSMSSSMEVDIEGIEKEIHDLAGEEFKINSPKQLSGILFEKLGLPFVKKTKTGYSTDSSVMSQLKNEHPIIEKVLEYRMLSKLKSTYLDALPTLVNKQSGRVHTSFRQTVAATGRLSSSDPNFQNIPVKTTIGREIRKAFKPQQKGWKILSADYSQIELRIMAHMSADESLIEAFKNGEDIHSRTAAGLFGVAIGDVLPEMRHTAKTVNFAIMYGARAFRLSNELGISMGEASKTIEDYFERFPGINHFITETIAKAREDKYVSTLHGRRRYLPEIDSGNFNLRQSAERIAINMPLQGSAADMIKIAMIRIDENLSKAQMNSMMILQVHDELVFETPVGELDRLKEMVEREMMEAMELIVPVKVDVGVGDSWFEAH